MMIEAPTFSVETVEPFDVELKLTANIEYTGFSSNLLIIDFGKKERKGKTETDIVLRNINNYKDIHIIAVSGSCGCTVPKFDKQDDGSYKINIKLNMESMAKGENMKILTISLKNGKKIKARVYVYGL